MFVVVFADDERRYRKIFENLVVGNELGEKRETRKKRNRRMEIMEEDLQCSQV